MKIKINLQSWSSLITNSSSEVFCTIESNYINIIEMVKEYLDSFLPFQVEYDKDDDMYVIKFSAEYTSDGVEKTTYHVIKKLLEEHFPGNNGFIITDGYNYN